jgi:beta-glucanase (GH16 family)
MRSMRAGLLRGAVLARIDFNQMASLADNTGGRQKPGSHTGLISNVWPATGATLDIDFINNRSKIGTYRGGAMDKITFSRASSATAFDINGNIITVAANVPRFDYDPFSHIPKGLLIEAARTNMVLNSSLLATQDIAVNASQRTLSFFGTGTVTLSNAFSAVVIGTSPTARTIYSYLPVAGTVTLTVSGTVQYCNDEEGEDYTSWIQTTSSPITRALEVAEITGTNFSSWYNQAEGTFYVAGAIRDLDGGAYRLPLSVTDGTDQNRYSMYIDSGTNHSIIAAYNAGAQVSSIDIGNNVAGTDYKQAFSYSTRSINGSKDGAATITGAGATVPVSRMGIGDRVGGVNNTVNNSIKRIIYFSNQIANNQLQALTLDPNTNVGGSIGGTPTPPPPPVTTVSPTGQIAGNYTIAFQDEFNGTTLDTSKWRPNIWFEGPNATQNYRVVNGSLKIWPSLDSTGAFYNRHIVTENNFYLTYGFVEMEAKLPIGKGVWPAFWMLNSDNPGPSGAEPEIDIMEAYPGDTGYWGNAAMHAVAYDLTYFQLGAGKNLAGVDNQGGMSESQVYFPPGIDLSASFNTYGVQWDSTSITFFFNGVRVGHTVYTTMASRMYILITLQMLNATGGPAVPNNQALTPTGQGNSLEVHYIRAWTLNNSPPPPTGGNVAPSQASTKGYNNRTFFDDFLSNQIGVNGPVWWTQRPWGYSTLDPSNYSVDTSGTGILHMMGDGVGPNYSIASAGPGMVGFSQRNGGYFEARMKILARGNGSGWPSFWTMAVEHLWGSEQNDFQEVDFMEDLGGAFGWPPDAIALSMHEHTPGNNQDVHMVSMGNSFNFLAWHIYGTLWVPATSSTLGYVAWYIDNIEVARTSWAQGAQYSVMDRQGAPLILGTSASAAFDCDWVKVWGA